MNKEKIFSPIAIDLGAKNTGVQCITAKIHSKGIEIENNRGITFIVDAKQNITFMQKDRTANRHRIRTVTRRKLVKRLFRCVLAFYNIDTTKYHKEIEFINGLFNRRGFTFIQEELDQEFFSRPNINKKLIQCFTHIHEEATLPKIDIDFDFIYDYLLYELPKFSKEHIQTLQKDFKKIIVDLQEDEDFPVTDVQEHIDSYLKKILEEKEKGAVHRKKYFENILKDLQNVEKYIIQKYPKQQCNFGGLLKALGFSVEEFANLIGNISNLQLRVLRKYFNDKTIKEDTWNEERLKKFIKNWIISWHCKLNNDITHRITLLKEFSTHSGTLTEWLAKTKPQNTIPPYEDQNNRRPPRCKTLYLNPMGLDTKFPRWQEAVDCLKKNHSKKDDLQDFFMGNNTDIHIPMPNNSSSDKEEEKQQKQAIVLQRILDISQKYDDYKIRKQIREPNNVSLVQEENLLLKHLDSDQELYRQYIEFATMYYKEIDRAKRGMWNHAEALKEGGYSIFFRCDCNPPHKSKVTHRYINNLFGSSIDTEAVKEFICPEKGHWNSKIFGATTCKNFAESIETTRKKCGNSFKTRFIRAYVAKDKYEKDSKDSDMKKLINNTIKMEKKEYFSELQEKLGIAPTNKKSISHSDRVAQLYILAQLYQLLETDIHGFSKDCKYCIAETGWRMSTTWEQNTDGQKYTRASRLNNDSVVPFDGFLGRYLERLAQEIAKEKYKQIEQMKDFSNKQLYIPIFLEQNKFTFEEELGTQKGTGNKKGAGKKKPEENSSRVEEKQTRIKNATGDCCPYCGNSNSDGQIDHIIPRSYSLKHYGTVFNGEANLLFACQNCNQNVKEDALYSFEQLSSNYLNHVLKYEQQNNTMKNFIIEQIEKIIGGQSIVNFVTLDPQEQNYIRLGLFIESKRKTIIDTVLNTRIRTMVNGTQAYLAKCINQELQSFAHKHTMHIVCYPFQIPTTDDEWNVYKSLIKKEEGSPPVEPTKELLIGEGGTSIKATRELITFIDKKYAKQEKDSKKEKGAKKEEKPQSYNSHIIDAAMTFASVLRSPSRIEEMLEKGDYFSKEERIDFSKQEAEKYNDAKDLQKIEALIPSAVCINNTEICRTKIKDGKKLWQKQVFLDTIYGEKFHPVVISLTDKGEGQICYGYIHPTGNNNKTKAFGDKNKNSDSDIFRMLYPFFKSSNNPDTYEQCVEVLRTSNKTHMIYTVQKNTVFQFYEDVFYKKNKRKIEDISTKNTVELLEQLRFIYLRAEPTAVEKFVKKSSASTQKNPTTNTLYFQYQANTHSTIVEKVKLVATQEYEKKQQKFKEIKNFLEKENLFESSCDKEFYIKWNIWLENTGQNTNKTFPKEFKKGKNTCSLEKVDELLKKHDMSKDDAKAMEKQANLINAAYFEHYKNMPRNKNCIVRNHKSTPTNCSFVLPVGGAGTFRVRRKNSQGQIIFQLHSATELTYRLDKEFLIQEISKSSTITPAKQKWYKEILPYNSEEVEKGLSKLNRRSTFDKCSERVQGLVKDVWFDPQGKGWITMYFSLDNGLDEYNNFYNATVAEVPEGKETQTIFTLEQNFSISRSKCIEYLQGLSPKKEEKETIIKAQVCTNNERIEVKFECRNTNQGITTPLGL